MTPQQLNALIEEGCGMLSRMPGVRSCVVGEQSESPVASPYPLCWKVRFTSQRALEQCRQYPDFGPFYRKWLQPWLEEGLELKYRQRSVEIE